eukprot:1160775-Pelagomonas_calceolata.AAC.2
MKTQQNLFPPLSKLHTHLQHHRARVQRAHHTSSPCTSSPPYAHGPPRPFARVFPIHVQLVNGAGSSSSSSHSGRSSGCMDAATRAHECEQRAQRARRPAQGAPVKGRMRRVCKREEGKTEQTKEVT